ncbi:MAG TPA: carboxypeptidase-like regulatory domain-containing protein [Kofleriaceae bacterium]|nr:carboxypeptidase-like regulatory domain-containing protein [Kofleriaceae bacterium]
MQLVACTKCNRHIRITATHCPFCSAPHTRIARSLLDAGGRLSRAAVFAGAAACYTSSPQQVQGPPPPPPPDDTVQQAPPPDDSTFSQPPPGDRQPYSLGRIEGTVSARGPGLNIGGIRVFVHGQNLNQDTTTDEGGRFRFEKLPPGTYTIELEGNGNPRSAPPRQVVTVIADGAATVTLVYSPYVPDRGPCCKPYGAPPARRRVV